MASLGTTRVGFEQLGANTIKPITFAGSTDSTYSSSLTGTFTISLSAQANQIGGEQLGATRVGRPDSFSGESNTTFGLSGRFLLDQSSQSTSNIDFTIARVFFIDFESNSISEFSFTLSEDSYEELYGETLSSAEKDTIVLGDGEKQIVVLANAEID